ncbi:chemotaxis protein CheA [Patescibacteria group bacterium]|nr:MAG: chemotaxis protein CheA [Patescibacteria group bacterium]
MVDISQYKSLFLEEARGYLQELNALMLSLEKSLEDKKILDRIMAVAHTFKGISATMGYNHLAQLAHSLEDIFDFARKGQLKITKEMFSSLFRALDALEIGVKNVDEKNKDEFDDSAAGNLSMLAQGKSEAQKIFASIPEAASPSESERSQELKPITRIGVDVKLLDMLMNLVEELTVEKLKISNLSQDDKTHQSADSLINELRAASRRLDRIVSELQYNVSRARMVPLEYIFMRFPRMARDTAKSLGKEASLEVFGGNVEMDRSLVEMLSEPLVHLIKNAIDHGLEDMKKRSELKKAKGGTISIIAVQERGIVRLIVRDDGQGIDWKNIAGMAAAKGLASKARIEEWMAFLNEKKYPPKELSEILFRPDFSTKSEVTEISGRGVGLAVVKNFVDRAGGRISIETNQGIGTSFVLEIPSTISATDALLVQVGEELFAVPFSSIVRSVFVADSDVRSFSDGDVAIVDGRELPLLWMRKFFNLSPKAMNYKVVIVEQESVQAGLVIDNIVSEQEVVVKPFSAALKTVQGFSGATVLGDGRVALVVDVASMLEQTQYFGRAAIS